MTKIIRNVRTTAGGKLLNSAISGDNKLIYTTAELYEKDVSSLTDTQLEGTTGSTFGKSLLSGKISITDYNDNTVTASAEFLNANLTSDIAFKTIGWYATTSIDKAQGKPPVLFIVSQLDSEATMVSGNNDRTTSFFLPRIIMRISKAENVVLETGEVGFVTLPELEGKIADLAKKGLIDFGQKFDNGFDLSNLHNTSLHYVDKGSVIGLPETSKNDPKDLGGYLISLGKGDTTQDGVRIYFNPFTNKTFISYYLNKTNTWTDWIEVGSKSYTKEEINKILADYTTNAQLAEALKGKADVSELTKYVKSVESFKPDEKTGNISFLLKTYENQAIELNTFVNPGTYKLVNCTYKYVTISSIGEKDTLDGYLTVTKGKTDDDIFQYLITDISDNAKINFRKINPAKSIYPEFKKILDNHDVHRFNDPDKYYSSSDFVDLDYLTEEGIYHFMDAHVFCSLRTDALIGLPTVGDGTQFCGYLVVLRHDNFNREQILILNSGVEIPDLAFGARSISGINLYRPRFRKILKVEDESIDGREHYFTRNSLFDVDKDESFNSPLMPTNIVSNTVNSNRINLNNLINVYQTGSRVIDDFVGDSVPMFYINHFSLTYKEDEKEIKKLEGLFNTHTQLIKYSVKPIIYSSSYDTCQRVKSGGCVFERYHKKTYDTTDPKHGWLDWNYIEGYKTGLGNRSVSGILNSTENKTNKTTSYNTIGFDYPPVIPGFAPLYYFTGFYNEKAKDSWFPPGTYIRRIGNNFTVDVDLPSVGTVNGGLSHSGETMLEVTCVPYIYGGDNNAKREVAQFVQKAYVFSANILHVDVNNPSSPQYIYDYYFIRQGDIYIPIGSDADDFASSQKTLGKWNKLSVVS